jgi:LacI family transcriptional regulator
MTDDTRGRARRRSTAPTLRDVAEHAGVSPMTVSRVINGVSTVRERTRRLVDDAIREVGYSPNEAARRLAGAHQAHIAMLYAQASAYIAEFLFGGLEQARKHNAQFIVEKCEDPAKAVAEMERMLAEGTDGFLIAPPLADNPEVLDYLDANEVPAVVVTSSRVRDSICSVGIDAYRAAREMTEHLLQLGHRHIGFIAGHPRHATSGHRLAGFREALQDAGISMPASCVSQGYFTYRSGLDAAEQLLALEPRPTAIFASNDDMAAATAAVAHRLGLDVPADLSIVGFDDTPLATAIWPQLTTIHVPIAELTRAAADLLVQTIEAQYAGKRPKAAHVMLDYTLVRRQSDAAPRSRPHFDTATLV